MRVENLIMPWPPHERGNPALFDDLAAGAELAASQSNHFRIAQGRGQVEQPPGFNTRPISAR